MHSYYVVRAIGGALFLSGALVMAWNITMTILGYEREEEPIAGAAPALQPAE
jgi:cytochrome c oxidase cbb3-type subunit 1